MSKYILIIVLWSKRSDITICSLVVSHISAEKTKQNKCQQYNKETVKVVKALIVYY